jgi:hypothetical protein
MEVDLAFGVNGVQQVWAESRYNIARMRLNPICLMVHVSDSDLETLDVHFAHVDISRYKSHRSCKINSVQ